MRLILSTPTTEKLLHPPLTAITWSGHFLYGFISLTLLWRKCWPSTKLLQFIEVIGHLLVHSSLEFLTLRFSWFRSGLFSAILICWCASDHCPVGWFWPNFSCRTDGFSTALRILENTKEFIVNSMNAVGPGSVQGMMIWSPLCQAVCTTVAASAQRLCMCRFF